MDPVTTEANCRKGSGSIPGTGWNDALSGIQSSVVREAWMHLCLDYTDSLEESVIGQGVSESTSHSNH